ncbi:hypothetical protein [Pradoshia sp.]|uniref:hypothetical protein n=1 Tax=Pradoshia sp. TaxID=2651281 RepID=UPI003EFFA725
MNKLKVTLLATSILVGGTVVGYGFTNPDSYANASVEQKKQDSVFTADELKLSSKEYIQNVLNPMLL